MSKTIYLDGGDGFVGSAVTDAVLAAGFSVRSLVRRDGTDRAGVTRIVGDLSDAAAIDRAMAGCTAAVHLVGIIFERGRATFERVHVDGTAAVLASMNPAGVRRLVHVSSFGARPNALARYHQTKFAAEQLVRQSGLDATILRPSLIHGPRGAFLQQAAAWARGTKFPWLFMPYFGAGLFGLGEKRRVQPIAVTDVADAIVRCLQRPDTIGRTIDLVGPETLTWPAMYARIARAATGQAKRVVAVPAWYAKLLTRITPPPLLPFNRSQVQMAMEDSTADVSATTELLGRPPRTLTETLYADVAQT